MNEMRSPLKGSVACSWFPSKSFQEPLHLRRPSSTILAASFSKDASPLRASSRRRTRERRSSLGPRHGTCFWFVESAEMTSPIAESDLLMDMASFSSSPATPDFSTRSDPARSTSVSLPRTTRPLRRLLLLSTSDTNRCDRDDAAFRPVSATARCSRPASSAAISSFSVRAVFRTPPSTVARPSDVCCASFTANGARLPRRGAKRSRSASRYLRAKRRRADYPRARRGGGVAGR